MTYKQLLLISLNPRVRCAFGNVCICLCAKWTIHFLRLCLHCLVQIPCLVETSIFSSFNWNLMKSFFFLLSAYDVKLQNLWRKMRIYSPKVSHSKESTHWESRGKSWLRNPFIKCIASQSLACSGHATDVSPCIHNDYSLFEMRKVQNHQHFRAGFVDISRKGI